jgi:hypothetical protein
MGSVSLPLCFFKRIKRANFFASGRFISLPIFCHALKQKSRS